MNDRVDRAAEGDRPMFRVDESGRIELVECSNCAVLSSEVDRLQERVKGLVRFARHRDDCRFYTYELGDVRHEDSCDCGLWALKSDAPLATDQGSPG